MIGAILYIVSFIFAVSLLVLLPKRKEPANIFVDIMFSYVTVLCVTSVLAFLLKLLGISVNLFSMGVLFTIVSILAGLRLIMAKKVQKHYAKKHDVISISVLALAVGIFSLYIFTPYVHANYFNVDSYHHFLYASKVLRTGQLEGMFFNPLYNGMFMDLFAWALPQSWLYKAFILSDIYHIILELLFFYAVLLFLFGDKVKKRILLGFSLLYWCTFLVLSFIWGFVYWSMAAMLVEYIIILLKLLQDKKDSGKILYALIIVGIFATTMCYVAFAPGIVLSVLGVIVYSYTQEKNFKWNRRVMRYCLVIIAILAGIAFAGYFFIFYRDGKPISWVLQMGVQQNIGLELVLMFPLVLYTMAISIRDHVKLTVFQIAYLANLILQIVLTVLSICHIISTYYLQKPYFILLFLSIVIILEYANRWTKKNLQYILLYLVGMLGFMVLSYDGAKSDTISLQQSTLVQNLDVLSRHNVSDGIMSDNDKIYLMQYAMEELDEEDTVIPLIVSSAGRVGIGLWYTATYEEAMFISLPEIDCSPEKMDELLQSKGATHFIIFFDDLLYIDELNDYFNSFERVYRNDAGFIGKL